MADVVRHTPELSLPSYQKEGQQRANRGPVEERKLIIRLFTIYQVYYVRYCKL